MDTTISNKDSKINKSYEKVNRGISVPEMIKESKRIKEFNSKTPNFVKQALLEVSK